jgi:hypothetical protein
MEGAGDDASMMGGFSLVWRRGIRLGSRRDVAARGKRGRQATVATVIRTVETVLYRAFLAPDDESDQRRMPDVVPEKNTEEDICDR